MSWEIIIPCREICGDQGQQKSNGLDNVLHLLCFKILTTSELFIDYQSAICLDMAI